MMRSVVLVLLVLSMVSLPMHATDRAGAGVGDLAVSKALAEALERDGVARIEATLDLRGTRDAHAEHPTADSDVHPVVFDLAMMAAPGAMQIDQAGDFQLLKIAINRDGLARALAMPEVVSVRLDTDAPADAAVSTKASPCPSSSTRACLQTNFSLSANYGGVSGKVAAIGGDSATFWAYSSNNWEVVAKVLNGCGINNHWWLLAGAAGNQSYTVGSTIWLTGGSLNLGSWSASNKPILNLQLFSCS